MLFLAIFRVKQNSYEAAQRNEMNKPYTKKEHFPRLFFKCRDVLVKKEKKQ